MLTGGLVSKKTVIEINSQLKIMDNIDTLENIFFIKLVSEIVYCTRYSYSKTYQSDGLKHF